MVLGPCRPRTSQELLHLVELFEGDDRFVFPRIRPTTPFQNPCVERIREHAVHS